MLCYGLLFGLAWILVSQVNFLAHLDMVMLFFKNGMTIHFILAILLLIWGMVLLKKRADSKTRSHGWLLLTLPCPLCFSVIVLSSSFLHRLLPNEPWLFPWLGAGFISISLFSALILAFFSKGKNAEHGLGAIMVLAALYFLLTLAVVPQFADMERIYRLSMSSTTIMASSQLPLLLAAISLIFAISFIKSFWRTSWT
jgi:predicted transporter